jgi:hypothetical protein
VGYTSSPADQLSCVFRIKPVCIKATSSHGVRGHRVASVAGPAAHLDGRHRGRTLPARRRCCAGDRDGDGTEQHAQTTKRDPNLAEQEVLRLLLFSAADDTGSSFSVISLVSFGPKVAPEASTTLGREFRWHVLREEQKAAGRLHSEREPCLLLSRGTQTPMTRMSHCVLQEPRALGATRTRMGSSVLWIQLFVA